MLGALARSRTALVASAAWGYAEATRFWIVPDVLIGWVALHGVRHGVGSALAATAGAVVGGIVVHRDAARQNARFVEIPGINQRMLDDAEARFTRDGWGAVVRAPVDGIPYKVYAARSALAGCPLEELVMWTPVARFWRFALVALVPGVVGGIFRRSLRRSGGAWLLAYSGLWAIVYARYFSKLRRTYGD